MDRLPFGVPEAIDDLLHIGVPGRIFPVVEGLGAVMVHKGVHPFVHPGVKPLIGSHEHREPVVAEFMIGHSPKPSLGGLPMAKREPRIFHTTDDAGHVAGGPVGVGVPFFRIVLDGSLGVFCGAAPSAISVALLRIKGHDGDVLSTRDVRFGRIPYESGRGGPSEIARLLDPIMPGQLALSSRTGLVRVAGFLGSDDVDRLVRSLGFFQAVLLFVRQHIARVLQLPGRCHDVVTRDGHFEIEIPILKIELPGPQVGFHVPAFDIIEHAHAGIPLSEFIDPSIFRLEASHSVRSILGDGEMKVDPDLEFIPGPHSILEIHLHPRVVDRIFRLVGLHSVFDPDVLDHVALGGVPLESR